jgi:hypothetical protein
MSECVFGFGSLVEVAALADYLGRAPFAAEEFHLCRLAEYRRSWNIARDNTEDIPGLDHFVRGGTGARIDGFIVSVNIVAAPGAWVNGIAFRATADEIATLDRREANYDRIEVTDLIDSAPGDRVWAFRGKAECEKRYADGIAAGTAMINSAYHTVVHLAFESHGADFLADYLATTDPPEVPLHPLRRASDLTGGS